MTIKPRLLTAEERIALADSVGSQYYSFCGHPLYTVPEPKVSPYYNEDKKAFIDCLNDNSLIAAFFLEQGTVYYQRSPDNPKSIYNLNDMD